LHKMKSKQRLFSCWWEDLGWTRPGFC
jgi:hypothetical protein